MQPLAMHSPRRRGLSAVRPEIKANRFFPSATGGRSAMLLKNWIPADSSLSFWNSPNSGPPGPLAPNVSSQVVRNFDSKILSQEMDAVR